MLKRHIHSLIMNSSRRDSERAENVCLISRNDLLDIVCEYADLSVVPDIVKGEILIDARGQGSLQTMQMLGE